MRPDVVMTWASKLAHRDGPVPQHQQGQTQGDRCGQKVAGAGRADQGSAPGPGIWLNIFRSYTAAQGNALLNLNGVASQTLDSLGR